MFSRQPISSGPYDSLDALAEALKSELTAAAGKELLECTTLELRLSLNAFISLVRPSIGPYADGGDHDLPNDFKNAFSDNPGSSTDDSPKHPKAPVSAILNIYDPRSSQIVQRAASRGIQQIVEAVDGFRYSFNNAWAAKDGEGSRFSYICQDSMQNKDRHANMYTRVLKHLKDPNGAERGPRKPTYDCKGSISVKFSTNRQSCDIYYRHYACHETVAARKPAARGASNPARRTTTSWTKVPQGAVSTIGRVRESGGISATLRAEDYASSALAIAEDPSSATPAASNISRPLKRKRTPSPPAPVRPDPAKPLSLVELLKQSETAKAPAPSPPGEAPKYSNKPAPVSYDLPSWQTPPPTLNKPGDSLPYPLPYQPKKVQEPVPPASVRPPSTTQRAAMNAVAPEQKVYQQFRLGAPSENQPQAQGLFTTMKQTPSTASPGALPWPAASYNTPQHPPGPTQFVKYVAPRAKQSCTNCRYKKQRCDEGEPCGSCAKKGVAHECVYDQPRTTTTRTHRPLNATFQTQSQPVQTTNNEPTTVTWQHPSGSTYSVSSQNHHNSAGPSQTPSNQNRQGPTDSSPASSSQDWQVSGTPAPLQAWGALSMAPPISAREESPDEWWPKR